MVIGRNEGDRLLRCIESLRASFDSIVYVDSGSSDASVDRATGAGARVVELTPNRPFSAARGRNAGLQKLLSDAPDTAFVQFVDGDCEVVEGWAEAGLAALGSDPGVAVVCGRRRERHPDASVYNRLCDLEWNTPVGETGSCGGDAMVRVSAFLQVEGFNDAIVAGEEPDLCLRLREVGHRILRIDQEMTRHDAALFSWSGWSTRVRRGGHAAAEGWFRHRAKGTGFMAQRVRSALLWGFAVPLVTVLLLFSTSGASLIAYLALAGLQWWRTSRSLVDRGRSAADARLEGLFLWLGKPSEATGVLQYLVRKVLGRGPRIIEYKGPDS